MKPPLRLGDKVRKWTVWNKKLGKEVWTVGAVRESVSQSGFVCDVYIDRCPRCGRSKRQILGYDCDWYVRVEQ